jgi:tRNA pseudouridine38-40 synthase
MRTLRLLISFDGTGYCGWQKQDNGPSIQAEIERAVSLICDELTVVHGAGRTDAGVHALGMTAHFNSSSGVDCESFSKGLNSLLPPAIRILEVSDQDSSFHARFCALAKTYFYQIYTGPTLCPTRRLYNCHVPYKLSRRTMRHCLETLLGTHDFSSFETAGSRDKDQAGGRGAVRTIFKAELSEPEPDFIRLTYTGDGFLRHMVRNITGTIIEAGRGKTAAHEFAEILGALDRSRAGATAPACGLTLFKVHYEQDW